MKKKQHNICFTEIVFVCVAFVIYFSLSCSLPILLSPDEPMRYQVAQFIYQHHSLPSGTDPELIDATWGFSYAFTPYLPEMISALLMRIISIVSDSPKTLLITSRFVSVLAATGSVYLALLIAKKMEFCARSKWLFTLIVGFLPQFVFLAAYLNHDACSVFAAMMILYGWLLGKESAWDYKSSLFLAVGISVCVLTYYNAYGWVLCSIFFFFGTIWQNDSIEHKWKHAFSRGGVIAGAALLLAGWFFVRNAILYDGDFLALRALQESSQMYAYAPYKPSNRNVYAHAGLSVVAMLRQTLWIKSSIKSFFAVFGYMNIFVSRYFYWTYFWMAVTGGVGCLYGIWKKKIQKSEWLLYGCCLLCVIIPTGLSIYYSYATDFQAQGRYLMPALPAVALLMTSGFRSIDEGIGKKREIFVSAALALWAILFLIIFVTTMIPQLYKGIIL